MSETKTARIYVRLPIETRNRFFLRAARFGVVSEVLRELLTAFADDRVTILPPPDKESLYNARNQD